MDTIMKMLFGRTIDFIKQHRRVDMMALFLGLAVFLFIAFSNVSNASIWFDEAFGAYLIQFSFVEIAQFTAADVHPPVYYWLLKVWSMVFGTTELALRSMSIFFGGLAIIGGFFMTRKFFGRSAAWVSLLFLVLSPTLIRYSDEARMYTLACVIVMAAAWVLTKAMASRRKVWWIAYGLLVSLGMWTHYFTAVAWLAHWLWRALTMRRYPTKEARRKAFFSKNWVMSHAIAVGLFLPWVPAFVIQTGTVQAGFWIGPVGAGTPGDYLANYFFYLNQSQALSWWGAAFWTVLVISMISVPKVIKRLSAAERKNYLLVTFLAWASPLILFVLSLPPLRPVFVERYLIPAIVFSSIFFAVTLVVGTRTWRLRWRAVPIALVSIMMIFGISNVVYYGNFNKNSLTNIKVRQVVEQIHSQAEPGTPIIATTPWVFYEATFYSTDDYPVYFIDATTSYEYGSLNMLRDRDFNKIKDIDAFTKEHPVFWYIGGTEDSTIAPHDPSWQPLRTVSTYDEIMKKSIYKATEFKRLDSSGVE